MNYQVTTKNFELTELIREEIEVRLSRLERRLSHFQPSTYHAALALERHSRRVEYNARLALTVIQRILVARRPAPTIEAAIDRVTTEIDRQIERYKSRLRREYLYERKRAALSAEERRVRERELLEGRVLLDRAEMGEREAFQKLTERELPGLAGFIERSLARQGQDTSGMDSQITAIMEDTILSGLENLRRKPGGMTLQGWLSQHARKAVKRLGNKNRSPARKGVTEAAPVA